MTNLRGKYLIARVDHQGKKTYVQGPNNNATAAGGPRMVWVKTKSKAQAFDQEWIARSIANHIDIDRNTHECIQIIYIQPFDGKEFVC
jgi:hypothetical protein